MHLTADDASNDRNDGRGQNVFAPRRFAFGAMAVAALVVAAAGGRLLAGPAVLINELHVDPDVKTERVEFVELYNGEPADVNLSGWQFRDGIFYTFPQGATLPAGGYVIVAQEPSQIHAKWSEGRFSIRASLVFGPYGGKLDNERDHLVLCDAAGQVIDEVEYQVGFPWPTVGNAVPENVPGSGRSMQLTNPQFDNDLGGSWRSATPTPAAANKGVFVTNIPPQIRQVTHSPKQPKSGEVVTITVKVTDPNGVEGVTLMYQAVDPGNYISRQDPQYNANWNTVAMHDAGLDGDAAAQDDVFTVQLAAPVQTHRRLVRYKIAAADTLGRTVIVPYNDDPQPNFAYFVYDGVPAWRGAVQPGVTPAVEFPPEVMRSLPVYHLISKKADVEDSTWLSKDGGDLFRWWGTLVYDGEVYDHVRYRMRGGVWRYSMAKNMFKFDLNRGHYFQARDDYGNKYKTKWNRLNFSACIQQGSFGQRGEQGMFEALSFRLFNLAGCPASKTNYLQFRIIDEPYEDGARNAAHPPLTGSGTQYDGDFWGLYMTIEQMDGRFLDEHGLPDGNLYKMDPAYPGGFDKNNQGWTAVADDTDILSFLGTFQSNPAADWWGRNVNLDAYYAYYAIYQAVHHGDITSKNWFLYLNPEPTTNEWGTHRLWWQLPWDLDLTWTTYYGSSDPSDPWRDSGLLNYEILAMPCRNRVREVVDLLFNPEQTGRLIDEYAAIIDDPAGGLSMVDADRAMWDYHWVVSDAACSRYRTNCGNNKAGQGRFYQEAVDRGYPRSFEGMVRVMKDYIAERMDHMNRKAADLAIPNTPVVTLTGPQGFPANALTFRTSPFSDPQGGGTFAAVRWRIAEVSSDAAPPVLPNGDVLLLPDGAMWKYFKGLSEPSPASGAWCRADFDDSQWLTGQTAIGYGEAFIVTTLADMRTNYSTVYLRNTFDVASLNGMSKLILEIKYDDGVNVWINEKLAYRDNVAAGEQPYTALALTSIEDTSFVRYEIGDPRAWLRQGTNVIAVQLLNFSVSGSSDCFIDVRLIGERGQGGTGQPGVTPAVRREAGHYEIEPLWESPELTTFAGETKIPASVVKPGRTYRVRCRMKDTSGRWSHWSAPVQFIAGEPIAAGILADLRVTELMYNPVTLAGDTFESQEYEFIELKNTGDEMLDLTSVSFTKGITFEFTGSAVTTLGPGDFVLMVKNKAAFTSRYGSALSGRIAGQFQGKLANDGENVALVDFWNGTIAEFQYGDGRGWPPAADGAGHSLVPLDSALLDEPQGSLDYSGNWRASTYIGGSPGEDDPAPPQTLQLNEFVANAGTPTANDWVELYNPGTASVSLAGWYLSDDIAEPNKYALPAVSVASHGWTVLGDLRGFGLSSDGEELVLSYLPGTGDDRIVDAISFKAQEAGISLGRYPDGGPYWFRMKPSQGKANTAPTADVVINELMYYPADANEEYIELYNPTSQAVALAIQNTGWRLNGAVDYNFPAGATIPAGGRIVVVGFDPQVATSRLAAFTAADGGQFTPGVTIFGPWSGVLSNRSERLSLEKPQLVPGATQPAGWVIIDEVTYSSTAPWPSGASGTGDCLHRIATDATHSGNDPTNWQAAAPTPGKAP